MKIGNKEEMMENIEFWEDKQKGILKATLLDKQAEAWAQAVFNDAKRDRRNEAQNNKPTQLRRFYEEVLRFDTLLKGNEADGSFEKYLPYIKMLNAKVSYAKGREHVSARFMELIKNCLSLVETREDFEAFKSFFEAFMGYYRYLHPKNN